MDVDGATDTVSKNHQYEYQGRSLYYSLASDLILGHNESPSLPVDRRACFNCGSPDHAFSSCPEPLDRARVTAARAEFSAESDGNGPSRRIHQAGEDLQRRLNWLDTFKPGQIVGPALRDALGLDDPSVSVREIERRREELPWYQGAAGGGGMMRWGYPIGYYTMGGMCNLASCSLCKRVNDVGVSNVFRSL